MIINSHKFLNKTSCKNLKSFPLLDEEAMSKHSDEEKDNLNDINTNFILATRYNNTNFNLWHCYAMFNYKLYKSLLNYKNEEKNNENNLTKNSETNYAMNAVEGFKNSIILGRQKRKKVKKITKKIKLKILIAILIIQVIILLIFIILLQAQIFH